MISEEEKEEKRTTSFVESQSNSASCKMAEIVSCSPINRSRSGSSCSEALDVSSCILNNGSSSSRYKQFSRCSFARRQRARQNDEMPNIIKMKQVSLNARKQFKFLHFETLISILLISWLLLLLDNCCLKSCSAIEMAPRITIQPNDLIAIEGESAELNCDAEGEPEPTIEWYHNGQLIKSSTHSRTTMGGSIQFLDIRPSTLSTTSSSSTGSSPQHKPTDTGIYYCLARNSLGETKSRNASLQVACK